MLSKVFKKRAGKRSYKRSARSGHSRQSMATSKAYAARATKLHQMRMYRAPFPPEYKTTFSYPPIATTWTSALAPTGVARLLLNSITDIDVDNVFGNSSPLFFSRLLSSTGPYKSYRVTGWRVKITIQNITGGPDGIQVMLGQGQSFSGTDVDTWSEISFLPGTQTKILTPLGGYKSEAVMEINGKPSDFLTVTDSNQVGSFGTNPPVGIYGYLGVNNYTNPLALRFAVCLLTHIEQDVILYDVDN